ncbi:hypothetical protein CTAM01_01945 [Colletotrichum tamarilloi]|uniref:Uncharacterized protein n=1 Tax=Colletotrichum tamarilloi TaxID=1209934 RepID=A0ABQ9RQ15_9PEZI|nr:uncharacterized protein CTAM01_01945 [Colletotrichum tamarilloi]KAK1509822.1 hypothetical protein CTAM01_01945 [Colletotrichum tamarilloi]
MVVSGMQLSRQTLACRQDLWLQPSPRGSSRRPRETAGMEMEERWDSNQQNKRSWASQKEPSCWARYDAETSGHSLGTSAITLTIIPARLTWARTNPNQAMLITPPGHKYDTTETCESGLDVNGTLLPGWGSLCGTWGRGVAPVAASRRGGT